MIKRFKDIRVSGMSLVLPQKEISIYDELQYYGNSEKKAERAHRMAGFWKRRVADENVTPADMGVAAAERLISGMGLDRSKIEAMIFVVQQPDYRGPVTAYSMHERLGLSKDCYVTDITQGCVGWCFGLLSAYQMIASGAYRSVLLINGDAPTYHLSPDDRINAPLFGDAGLATYVEFSEGAGETVFNLETVSAGWQAIVIPASGRRLGFDPRIEADHRAKTERFMTKNGREACLAEGYMDGAAVFDFTVKSVPANLKALMAAVGTTVDTYDFLALHQANKQIVQTVGQNAGFPLERISYAGFENYGNNTMCSIPTTILHEKREELKSERGIRTLCSGFGNGLVVCSVDMTLKNLAYAEMNTYSAPDGAKTNAQWRTYWREKFENT